MPKRKRETTATTIEKRISEGLGQGSGAAYTPWLKIHDVGSNGVSSRISGWTTSRVHHLLSRLETANFYVFDWSKQVIDLREQFPLLPIEETVAIAELLGVRHPSDPKTRSPVVMTTDFLLTIGNGLIETEVARIVKPANELASPRVIEKFSIEWEYWKSRGINWGVLCENQVTQAIAANVEWIHNFRYLPENLMLDEKWLRQIEGFLLPQILQNIPLSQATSNCDDRLGLELGTALSAVRHFIATHRWAVKMTRRIDPTSPLIFTKTPASAAQTVDAA